MIRELVLFNLEEELENFRVIKNDEIEVFHIIGSYSIYPDDGNIKIIISDSDSVDNTDTDITIIKSKKREFEFEEGEYVKINNDKEITYIFFEKKPEDIRIKIWEPKLVPITEDIFSKEEL